MTSKPQGFYRRNLAYGLCLSPFIVAVVTFFSNCIDQTIHHHIVFAAEPLIASFFYCCFLSLPSAYLAELLLGVPVWFVFRHYGISSGYSYGLCGALIGLVAVHILSICFYQSWIDGAEYLLTPARWMNLPTVSAIMGGSLAALFFRSVSVPPRNEHRGGEGVGGIRCRVY